MKTKKLGKKLFISRITVANLNDQAMGLAKGGATATCSEPECEPGESYPYICPSDQPYSTCFPGCSSVDPQCVWPHKTDITC